MMNPEFRPMNPNDKHIYELMPILIGIGPHKDLLFYGSCFIAWPGMAITAKHNIEEIFKCDPDFARNKPSKANYWLVQVKWDGDDHSYVVWTIDSVGLSAHSDIAIIWLRPWERNATQHKEWKALPVTFDIPPIGATVRAFGYHDVCFDGSRFNKKKKLTHLEVSTQKSISTGTIKQIYWQMRDRGKFSFPCFEVNARFKGGMSGGFVLNEKSEVCGIVCGSGLPPNSPDEEDISYVTMLWPMMAIPVDPRLVQGSADSSSYRLKDMSTQGVFTPKGWDRVLIKDQLDIGGPLTMSYQRIS